MGSASYQTAGLDAVPFRGQQCETAAEVEPLGSCVTTSYAVSCGCPMANWAAEGKGRGATEKRALGALAEAC